MLTFPKDSPRVINKPTPTLALRLDDFDVTRLAPGEVRQQIPKTKKTLGGDKMGGATGGMAPSPSSPCSLDSAHRDS